MADPKALAAMLAMPVTNRDEAGAFLIVMVALDLDYHFDDGAVDCLHGTTINGVPLVTLDQAETIDQKVRECYAAWEASGADLMHDCPIGYVLELRGHIVGGD